MIVLKFGGTSLRDSEWILRALRIAEKQIDRAPVIVASAMGKTTDRLAELADHAQRGEHDGIAEGVDALEAAHERALQELTEAEFPEADPVNAHGDLAALFGEVRSLLQGVALIRECSSRTMAALLSFGERLSTLIIHAAAASRGIPTVLLDSRKLIRTDSVFASATPDFDRSNVLLQTHLQARAGKLHIMQGFIASDANEVTTTLGRGGSDYTATIVGAALDAEEVQIWTDVDGIMTADPRLVSATRTLKEISYVEAAELAFFGARVVHPYTIQPAIDCGIPVYVRNTGKPEHPGTRITEEFAERGVRAITLKRDITVITVNSYRMLNAYGFLSRIFDVFARNQVSVDLVATSEVSVSMTVDAPERIPAVRSALEQYGQVSVEADKAIVSLVGKDLWKDSSVLAKVFQTLEGIPVRLISLGSSDTNLSLVVSAEDGAGAVTRLHEVFFPDRTDG